MDTCQDLKENKLDLNLAMNEQELQPEIQKSDAVITEGSTWAAIWHLAWPLMGQMSVIALASFCDVYVAGKMGSDVQAAIGLCGQIWFLMMLITVALSVGTNALVSRYWGAKDLENTIKAGRQAMTFGFVFGGVSAAAGMLAAKPLLVFLGASPEVQRLGWEFISVDLLSQIPFTAVWVAHSIWRAKGNARVPMVNWIIMALIVVALDFALCIHPFHIGISGIGWSWVVAAMVGVLINVMLLKRTELAECVNFKLMIKEGLSRDFMWRLLKIGIPACINDLVWIGSCCAFFLIFAQTKNPTACQASWAVGFRLEEIVSSLPLHALSMAVATIVGQNLGAKQPQRAERAGWQVASIGAGYTSIMAVFLFCMGGEIAKHMSSDPVVLKYVKDYLQIVGMCQPFVALWLVLFGAMQGAGYTVRPMWMSIICLLIIRLPLAYYLTKTYFYGPNDGPLGCWVSVAASAVVIGILAVWSFKSGVWKTQKV